MYYFCRFVFCFVLWLSISSAASSCPESTTQVDKERLLVLLKLLESEHAWQRSEVARELSGVVAAAVPTIVPRLVRTFADSNARVRDAAAQTLGSYGPEAASAIQALIELLNDDDRFVFSAAVGALSAIGEPAIPFLFEAMGEDEFDVGSSTFLGATNALEGMGVEIIPYLVAALDQGANQSAGASGVLRRFGTEAAPAVPSLARCLSRPEADVRQSAAITLGLIGPSAKAAIAALVDALSDPDTFVRGEAAKSARQNG